MTCSAEVASGKTVEVEATTWKRLRSPGTKDAFAPLGVHAQFIRTRSGRRHGRPCRTFVHVLRGRGMHCVRLVLLDAADPGGEPRSRRLQAAATNGHYLRCAADVGARGDHARCRGGAG